NAWDAMSARIVASEGFPAIATTSGGLAWALGYPDGEAAPWDEVVAATARIARTVSVPVTADIETGYGDTPEAGARSIGDIIGAVNAPVNIGGVRAGFPNVAELEALGVRRASTATAVTLMVVDAIRSMAGELYETGRFDALKPTITHPEAQQLFGPKSPR